MCGITGIFNVKSAVSVDESLLRRMTDTLRHRGPDDSGIHLGYASQDKGFKVGLGHRRLSIIDLSGSGRQPLSNEDGSVWIVFNGEVYNFIELRQKLIAKGHTFKSATDSEVIVHLYEEKREKCVDELRGMFAFAIWDERNKELFAARDRIGKKPFYYYWDGERFIFGSEIKAIVEDRSIPRKINVKALDSYLTFLCVPSPMTIFENIYKLPPGHYALVSESRLEVKEYWDLNFNGLVDKGEDYYVERLNELFSEAVLLRLVSDVPLGSFLSGGIDSSAVVAVMSKLNSSKAITNSIGFNTKGFDELDYARLVAKQFQTQHHEFVVEPKAIEVLEKLAWHFDEPFADASAVPTYYVSKMARENVKVSLSGDGGDEVFAGYIRRYFFNVLESKMRSAMPSLIKRYAIAPLARIYPKYEWMPRFLRAKYFLTNISLAAEDAYYRDMSIFKPEFRLELYSNSFLKMLNGYTPADDFKAYFVKAKAHDHLGKVLYVDSKTYLPNDILVKVDRMSMANSLEVRSPLLDHKLMEFAADIPSGLKLRKKTSKYIFKKTLEKLLPADILYRPKQGFALPIASWFRNDIKDYSYDILFSQAAKNRGYFKYRTVEKMWDQHQRGIQNYADNLWILLMLELWHRNYAN